MRMVDLRMVATAALLVLTLASGLWLSLSGRPYNTGIFTVHKLIALGAVIVTGITLNHLRLGVAVPMSAFIAMIFAAVLFLLLFVSGALLSIGKPDLVAILMVHRVVPLLAAAIVTMAIYLLAAART